MRTDVKVGLICVFALVLAVVAYFAFQSNPDKQKAPESSTIATGSSTPETGVTAAPALAVAPVEAATTSAPSMTAPETPIAGGGALLGPRTALAQVAPADSTFTGPTIAPPGSTPATAPAPYPSPSLITTPTTPTTGPSLSGPPSLLPPVTPAPTYTPTPIYTPTATPPRGTVDILPPSHRPSGFDMPLPGPADGVTPTPSGSASTYTIQKGDMLGSIAHKNGVSLKALEAANRGVDPSKLKVGAKINIPAATPSAPVTPTSHTPATTRPSHTATTRPAAGTTHRHHPAGTVESSGSSSAGATDTSTTSSGTYTVKKGDNLHKIAKATLGDDAAWKKIAAANNLKAPYDIAVGQILKIPAK